MKANTLLILGVVSGVLCAVMLGLGIFTAAFLDGILVTKAAERTALKPDSYDQWGQVPGSTGVNVTRNFIFYNFTNAFEAFWFNATPVFAQMPGQLYQESQNFLNATYDDANPDDATHVNYGYQLRLNALNAPTETVTTLNVGPLGFWYSAQKLPPYQIGFYGLVSVIQQLSSQLLPTIQACGLLSQYLLTSANTATALLAPLGITETARQDFMWNDPIFGLGNPATLAQWIPAIIGGQDSDAAFAIQDNFYLTYAQTTALFQSTGNLAKWLTNVNTVIQTAYGCSASPCDGTYLLLKQWTTQGVTKNPPTGPVNAIPYFPASDSVASLNPSVTGYIEISNFLTNYFLVNEDVNKTEYQNLAFAPDLAASLLNITDSGGQYKVNTEPTSLVNIGNLATIYAYGELFDATKQTSDLSLLTPIANQFNLPSVQHAFVVWKYLQYFEQESIVLKSNHGTVADLIAGQIFVTTFDLLYTLLTIGPFPGELKQRVIYNFTAGTTCAGVLQVSTTLTAAQIATVCSSGAISAWDATVMGTLYNACQRQNYTIAQKSLPADLTLDELAKLCTTTGDGTFYSYYTTAEAYMKNAYSCSAGLTTVNKCSDRELIVKQWGSSEITQNVPPALQQYYTPALTLQEWYASYGLLFMFPFEYLAAIQKLGPNFNNDETLMAGLPYDLANQLFSTNALRNQVLVQNAFIAFNTQNWPYISQVFGSINPYNLISFIRFVVVEYAFQGFSQNNVIHDLLWGYDDFFLGMLAGQPVYNSGDPSINPHVALAGKNCTGVNDTLFNATMYTGNSDRSLTRQFVSIDDITTVTYSNAYFDGSAVVNSLDSPWDQAIPLTGTDGNINPPGLDESDEIHVYLSDINYIAPLTYDSTHDYSGIDAYRFKLPESALQNVTNNPDNQQWYANRWNGLLNISKLQKAPLFISKGHFLDADPAMHQNIKVYNDSTLAFEATPGPGDDTYLDVEPYSGVSVGTMVRLQINYEYQPDSLLPNPNYSMMPILLTERGMNFTSDQIEDTFSDLKAGIKFKHIGIPVFFTLFVVFLGTTIFIFWKRRAMIKRGVVHDAKSPYHKFVEERESSGHNQSGPSPAGDGGDSRGEYAKEPYERA